MNTPSGQCKGQGTTPQLAKVGHPLGPYCDLELA